MEQDQTTDCLTDELLGDFILGRLDELAFLGARSHLGRCPECSSVLAATARAWFQQRAEAPPSAAQVSRYRLLDVLGAGAMGVVYSALDTELERKVAIKALPLDPQEESGGGRARQLLEARAMARLSHPNVVTIHDATFVDGWLYVVMELVEGVTLREWLAEARRGWREVTEVFLAAGRGLAAAHEAGIVHRDFKPENVLIGPGGRVRVGDFGLAHGLETAAAEKQPPAGTPAYMAPEQLSGQAPEPRGDQFSFCVALFEALHGQRPYSGATVEELTAHANAGRLAWSPDTSRIPSWLRAVVARGLRPRADERFQNMRVLLDELERGLGRRRRARNLAAAASAALLAVGAAVVSRGALRPPAEACESRTARAASLWTDARRASLKKAVLGTGAPYAADTWTGVEQTLGEYLDLWRRRLAATCAVGTAPALQELQLACLDRRLDALAALLELLSVADKPTVRRSLEASQQLSSPDACTGAEPARWPTPPADPSVRVSVEQLRAGLSRVEALDLSGHFPEGLELATEILGRSRALQHLPLEAEALYWAGRLQGRTGQAALAEATLKEAVGAAQAAQHDRVAALAWISLMYQVGYAQRRFPEAEPWARYSEAAILRLGGDTQLELRRLDKTAALSYGQGKFSQAKADYARILKLSERGADPLLLARVDVGLAYIAFAEGELDRAIALSRRASEREAALGSAHPEAAARRANLGVYLTHAERFNEADQVLQGSLATVEASLGPAHPTSALVRSWLARSKVAQGQFEAASALLGASANVEPSRETRGELLELLGDLYGGLGEHPRALAYYRRWVELADAEPAPASSESGAAHAALAHGLWMKQDLPAAQVELGRAVARLDGAPGRELTRLARALCELGETQLALGQAAEAAQSFGRLRPWTGLAPSLRLRAEAGLARAQSTRR